MLTAQPENFRAEETAMNRDEYVKRSKEHALVTVASPQVPTAPTLY